MTKILIPYYKQPRLRGVRPNYTPEQLTKIKQFIRIVRPFTRKSGFRQITKHDILMFPGLVDREGHLFTASLVALLAAEMHGFYVARATIERLLGGNLRRRKGPTEKLHKVTAVYRKVRELETRQVELEKLIVRMVVNLGTVAKD